MHSQIAFVFDRLNENSLLAAAVAKQYAKCSIYDVEQIARHHFPLEGMQFHWLGMQPPEYLAKRLRGTHFCYMPDYTKKPSASNVLISNGNYTSVVEQLITEVIKPFFDGFDDDIQDLLIQLENSDDLAEEQIGHIRNKIAAIRQMQENGRLDVEHWIGIGFFINQFYERDTEQYVVHRAYNVIKMLFEYVYYNRPWDKSVIFQVNDDHTVVRNSEEEERLKQIYLNDVNETKELFRHVPQANFVHIRGRVVATQEFNITDHHWYIAKRLIAMAGQIWRAPRIVGDHTLFTSNERERLAA